MITITAPMPRWPSVMQSAQGSRVLKMKERIQPGNDACRLRRKLFPALAFVAFLVMIGCAGENPHLLQDRNDPGAFEIRGTVVFRDLEGGFFIIESDDGKTYEPLDLPVAYQKDGMKVTATVCVRNDVASIRMAGDIIEILEITAR